MGFHDRKQVIQLRAVNLANGISLASPHPINISPQRIDCGMIYFICLAVIYGQIFIFTVIISEMLSHSMAIYLVRIIQVIS